MNRILVEDLINICDAKLITGSIKAEIKECFIDSKKVCDGGCFFGIKGNNVDGSMFYEEAFLNGAKICVINSSLIENCKLKTNYKNKTILAVKDTKEALHLLASKKRRLFKGKVVAITGSIGKTSTKEMIYNILSKKYKVLKTIDNQNSQLGLPLTILRLKDEEIMVLEMGMDDLHQIEKLSKIAIPDVSIITNIYDSHIGKLGSKKNILKAKLEIISGMKNGILLVNNDNDMLHNLNIQNNNIKIITYGIKNKSSYMAYNIKEKKTISFDTNDIKNININGCIPFIYNTLASIIVAKIFKIENDLIKSSVDDKLDIKHRLETIKINNYIIIDDTYNANYESVKASLNYINKLSGRKIVIIGDILELGKNSINVHCKIGKLLYNYDINYLITIGKNSKYIDLSLINSGFNKNNIKHFNNELDSRYFILNLLKKDDVILIKGSNEMNLANITEYLKRRI